MITNLILKIQEDEEQLELFTYDEPKDNIGDDSAKHVYNFANAIFL